VLEYWRTNVSPLGVIRDMTTPYGVPICKPGSFGHPRCLELRSVTWMPCTFVGSDGDDGKLINNMYGERAADAMQAAE